MILGSPGLHVLSSPDEKTHFPAMRMHIFLLEEDQSLYDTPDGISFSALVLCCPSDSHLLSLILATLKCQIDVTNCLWDVSMWLCHYELKLDVPKIEILHKCFLASSLWLHTIEFLFVTFHFASKTEEIKTDLTSLLLLAFVSKSVTISIMWCFSYLPLLFHFHYFHLVLGF